MTVRLRRAEGARDFFGRARAFLLAAEAEHNLILGLSHGLVTGDHDYDEPIHLATVEGEGGVEGYVFRTPPFKVGVSALPPALIPAVVDDLSERYDRIPAVLGPEPTAVALAEAWAARFGGRVEIRQRMRIHRASVLEPDPHDGRPPPSGRLRAATVREVDLVTGWLEGFVEEARVEGGDLRRLAERMTEAGAIWMWDDDGPVSMVGATGATPNGIRIGYVWTPAPERGRGYATTAVAALTEHLLATGRRFVFLYTDLANPTSNTIYARIGYRPVCDVVDAAILPVDS